jgi:hypothetical protein
MTYLTPMQPTSHWHWIKAHTVRLDNADTTQPCSPRGYRPVSKMNTQLKEGDIIK